MSNLDLFGVTAPDTPDPSTSDPDLSAPLADRMRPVTVADMVGQVEALRVGGFLATAIAADRVPSLVLWGPPGCGKTTLARVIAHATAAHFDELSAVLSGVKEMRVRIEAARLRRRTGRRTILFVDEIHRFNKAQQDALLPHVERGVITLIGATTENPSFECNAALLSRTRVVVLEPLSVEDLQKLVARALADDERGLGKLKTKVDEDVLLRIAELADGDARRALNALEQVVEHVGEEGSADLSTLERVLAKAPLRYDKSGDAHYDTISAFIKSMRGSHPDAALYYAARMIEAGEDPRFILRRVLIFASEDVGNADPRALQVALNAAQAFERLGVPEGYLPMAQAITYCTSAPKSNASYKAWLAARKLAKDAGTLPIPKHLKNAPTKLMKTLGNAEGYQYPHDQPGHFVKAAYLPDELANVRLYRPTELGYERHIRQRLAHWWEWEG